MLTLAVLGALALALIAGALLIGAAFTTTALGAVWLLFGLVRAVQVAVCAVAYRWRVRGAVAVPGDAQVFAPTAQAPVPS